ncbi:hypothetical protein DV735_g908, partial [Chaetothyriales sp. CBS 134920]
MAKKNEIYQYSLVNALMAGVSDSGITVEELLTKGNQGLGTFVRMDGELLLLDGTVYQLQAEGKIRVAEAKDQIPYAVATHFEAQHTAQVRLDSKDSVEAELDRLDAHHSANLFMSYRLEGTFGRLKCRTVKGQEHEGESLAELGKRQYVKDYQNIQGTIIGFRSPAAWQGFFVAGEHMHFIDADRKSGGHVLDFSDADVRLAVSTLNNIHIELPTSDKFNQAKMETDDKGLKSVEG